MLSVFSLHLKLPDEFSKVQEQGMDACKYSLNIKQAEVSILHFQEGLQCTARLFLNIPRGRDLDSDGVLAFSMNRDLDSILAKKKKEIGGGRKEKMEVKKKLKHFRHQKIQ